MAIEIVSFPINSMVIFHSYVNIYQAGYILKLPTLPDFRLTEPGQKGARNMTNRCGGYRRSVLGQQEWGTLPNMDISE